MDDRIRASGLPPNGGRFRTGLEVAIRVICESGFEAGRGVMVDGSQGTVPWEDVRANLDLLAQTESGHVFWFSRSLLQSHAESLRAYYRSRGPARNPHMGGTVGLGR